MKRIFLIIITVFIAFIFYGCSSKEKDSVSIENSTFEEEEIKYEIEQVLFSKSFQSIEPSVEIMTKNNKLKILASLGLAECSGVNINNIVKKGNEVNIHVSGIYDKNNLRLAVPQVVMELKKSKLKNIEELKFNIVYDDYTPLKVKFSINDVLNKIQSHFKISIKGFPSFNLTRIDDNIVWDISYNSIFDKENPEIPLVNFSAQIDANNGDIIKSEKVFISSYLDDGHVLNYIPNDYILYKKSVLNSENDKVNEQLWYYDAINNEKTMLYSSNFKIFSAQFSPDSNYVSVIEVSDSGSDLYMISQDDKRAYKISFENKFHPRIMRWKDNSTLYLIENNDDKSIVYTYNIGNHETTLVEEVNKNIDNLIIANNSFIITEKTNSEFNKKISTTTDWQRYKSIDHGFNLKFISEDLISYLQKDENKDRNSLIFYDLEEKDIVDKIDDNILNYEVLPNKNIAYIKKDANNNDFTLFRYSLDKEETSNIANLIGDKIYYDENKNLVYLNITLPFENEKREVIYSIDLSKLN